MRLCMALRRCSVSNYKGVLRCSLSSCGSVNDARAASEPAISNRDSTAVPCTERLRSNETASSSGRDWRPLHELRACSPLEAGLYVVGTPIGNLEDITLRALRVLEAADVVLAEDTRHSRKLLNYYGIDAKLVSFHDHNERGRQEQVIEMLRAGLRVALISDAGMPLFSDPGAGLVRVLAEEDITIVPVPGPSAILAALVASGLRTDRFLFCGFLPPKRGARVSMLASVTDVSATLVFFVPPHSLLQTLADLAEVLTGDRRCVVAREITKVHEEFFRGSISRAHEEFSSRTVKGEVTLVIEGASEVLAPAASRADTEAQLQELLAGGCSPSAAAKIVSRGLGLPRNGVYALAQGLAAARRPGDRGAETQS